MSCSRPFEIINKYTGQTVKVPCRWCMSCRLDRQQELQDRFNFERLECAYQGYTSSYLTFTFDDQHYPRNGSLDPDFTRKFIFRLRDGLKYHKFPLPLLDGRRQFKYILVGEYGSDSGRLHYHALFAGLDYRLTLPYFKKYWHYGLLKSLPLLPGAVRYVLKYVEKQQHGDQIQKLYIDNGLVPPFMQKSSSLGKSYFKHNLDYILNHGGYFARGRVRPLSPYYSKLLGIEQSKDSYHSLLCSLADKYRYAAQNNITYSYLQELQSYELEKKLVLQARDSGKSVDSEYLKSLNPPTLDFKKALSEIYTYEHFSKIN